MLPKQRARGGLQPDEFALSDCYDLTSAAQFRQDRRAVAGTVPLPTPLDLARVHVVGRQRSLIVSADVKED